MIKMKILIILLFISVNVSLYSQIDTTLVITITKLQLLPEFSAWNGHKLDKDIVDKVLNAPIHIDFLQSIGFDNFIFTFIKLDNKDLLIDNLKLMGGCKGFILAVDTLNIESFRISGFFENDMLKLLMYLMRKSYHHLGCANSFSKYYAIEGVDLKCLYRTAKNNSTDSKKYPCLKYCGEPIWVY
jgi:hypothetical protein